MHNRYMTILDTALLEEIRNGNLKSFEIVFKGYYSRLCKYAYSMVKDYEVSSDLVKDTFINWWENHKRVMIITNISGYLYKSVHNNCINYLTRTHTKQITTNESDLTIPLSELAFPVSGDYPLANLLTLELEGALDTAIKTLPEQCREVFILSRMEQLSHDEIAQKLNISANTVKVHIYRALIKLKEELKEFLPIIIILFATN